MFWLSIQSTGSFIKKEDFRLTNEGSRNCNPLFLATTQFYTSFTHHCLVTLGELFLAMDKIICIRLFTCVIHHPTNLFIAEWFEIKAVHNVVLNSSTEQYGFLLYKGYLLMVPTRIKIFNISTVKEDTSLLAIVKSFNHLNNWRFSATRLSNQCNNTFFFVVNLNGYSF